jgi:phosphomannomutase
LGFVGLTTSPCFLAQNNSTIFSSFLIDLKKDYLFEIMKNLDNTIFKAYDIRGIYPNQVNEDVAYRIAQAYAKFIQPKTVALGRDVRLSGATLFEATKQGFLDHGVNVVDIGVITTDMYYFAVANYGYDGGVQISASHNPREYNGFKMVREKAIPISGDSGIKDIQKLVAGGYQYQTKQLGDFSTKNILPEYLEKCLGFVNQKNIKRFKVVLNGMFGPAVFNVRKMNLPIEIIPLNEQIDGSFPKGAPDPLLKENQEETVETIKRVQADFGAAWDGDADRFFLFDENGRFIPGYYLTAKLAQYFSSQQSGAKIIHDPRLVWATQDQTRSAGGIPLQNKAGHSFIKERMRTEDALFGGEMSGHFYFRDYFYADNGLIPFLLMLEIISQSNKKVSEIFEEYFMKYPISGEINTKLSDQSQVEGILLDLEKNYSNAKIDKTDGVSIEYPDWRANVRGSNTEPLIRLNVEGKSQELMKQKTEELLEIIRK